VLEFARWLVNGYGVNADATWILDHHELHLMLHTNPDGRKKRRGGLSWRKNTNNNHCANSNNRGADLNRNFSYSWNKTNGAGLQRQPACA
jgi:carboxypeptidase T